MKITVVGSGGLSHDPPTPRIDHSQLLQRIIQFEDVGAFLWRNEDGILQGNRLYRASTLERASRASKIDENPPH